MKHLTKGNPPELLTRFVIHKQPKTWDDISSIRQQLRKYILEEQGHLCAYTEIRINTIEDCHIDHYHTRNLYPEETFNYDNMLVSCNSERYGAKYKDKQIKIKTDYEELLNPVEERPARYIEFSLTGNVQPVESSIKGEKTISTFNLNERSLVERRKTAIINLLKMKDYLTEEEMLLSFGEFESMIQQLYRELHEVL